MDVGTVRLPAGHGRTRRSAPEGDRNERSLTDAGSVGNDAPAGRATIRAWSTFGTRERTHGVDPAQGRDGRVRRTARARRGRPAPGAGGAALPAGTQRRGQVDAAEGAPGHDRAGRRGDPAAARAARGEPAAGGARLAGGHRVRRGRGGRGRHGRPRPRSPNVDLACRTRTVGRRGAPVCGTQAPRAPGARAGLGPRPAAAGRTDEPPRRGLDRLARGSSSGGRGGRCCS